MMRTLLPRLDRATRAFWRRTGREVDLAGAQSWLSAPMSESQRVADGWLAAAADLYGGTVTEGGDSSGLLPDMGRLDGPGFAAADLDPRVRDFYEHTSAWRMEVWSQWTPAFAPAGAAVARLFGRRVQQLAIPTRSLDIARGMDSRVAVIAGPDGDQAAAAWIRTLRATGEHVYSGCYSIRRLPNAARPSVHVAFPLESGNVQVFLRPSLAPNGGLLLRSPGGSFGQDGAYVVVEDQGHHAARVPLHEDFHVFVDDDGELRTDHRLRLWSAPAVHLHYKLTRAAGRNAPASATRP